MTLYPPALPTLEFGLAEFCVQALCILSQSLLVHVFNCSVVTQRHCLLVVIHRLWPLQSFTRLLGYRDPIQAILSIPQLLILYTLTSYGSLC